MTELEKIAYAKSFIDKLAQGINPIDDTTIPENDIVNNIRLSRCFFYVSDILRQVIDNGGTTSTKKKARKVFSITQEQLSKFSYSEFPISISELAKKINELIDKEQIKQLTYRQLTNWLISINALIEQPMANGKVQKRPTDMGRELGISLETRNGINGEYQVVVYNKDAQRFILDNLDAVISLEKKN